MTIKLPDINKAFQYENNFYLSCSNQRINKVISHYELFKKTLDVPGAIVECGVYKGASLIRFATLRDIFSDPSAKKIIGFDSFTEYPEPNSPNDKLNKKSFVKEAGKDCISKRQLLGIFSAKDITNIELIEGNIIKTVPDYVVEHPELRISLLHLDCTMYQPTLTALENFYDRIVSGGLILLNGYGKEDGEGETDAVDDFFATEGAVGVTQNCSIRRLPFAFSPCYIVKKDILGI